MTDLEQQTAPAEQPPPEPFTPAEARYATDELKKVVGYMFGMVEECITRQAWRALGYSSFTYWWIAEGLGAYRLTTAEAASVMLQMTEDGRTQNEIAAQTGVSADTVARRQRELGTKPASPKGRPRNTAVADIPEAENQADPTPNGHSPAPPAVFSEKDTRGDPGAVAAWRGTHSQWDARAQDVRAAITAAMGRDGYSYVMSDRQVLPATNPQPMHPDKRAQLENIVTLMGRHAAAIQACLDAINAPQPQ